MGSKKKETTPRMAPTEGGMRVANSKKSGEMILKDPNYQVLTIFVRGTAPLSICKFSKKARAQIAALHAKKKAKKLAKELNKELAKDTGYDAELEELYEEVEYEDDPMTAMNDARHISEDGWDGISAAAFRTAMFENIGVMNNTGIQIKRVKLAAHIIPDGFDAEDGTPLVRIRGNEPELWEGGVKIGDWRNKIASIRYRPRWRRWELRIRILFDADLISAKFLIEMIRRVGINSGLGEGRDGTVYNTSGGMGYGTYQLVMQPMVVPAPEALIQIDKSYQLLFPLEEDIELIKMIKELDQV